MRKCPFCKREIRELIIYCRSDFEYRLGVETDGSPYWRRERIIDGDIALLCPKCRNKLFDNLAEAIFFLQEKQV